jgi:hypothetical protein
MDMVAQYVKGLDLYKCDKTNMVIKEPFWEGRNCEAYKKNSFGVGGIRKWIGDWVRHN